VWCGLLSDLAHYCKDPPIVRERRIQGRLTTTRTVGTFVGTAPTAWHISIHLSTSGYKSTTDWKGLGCRLSASESVSCKKHGFRFSRPPVSTAHTSLRVSVINSLPAPTASPNRRSSCSHNTWLRVLRINCLQAFCRGASFMRARSHALRGGGDEL
jgi:hypothetical protein